VVRAAQAGVRIASRAIRDGLSSDHSPGGHGESTQRELPNLELAEAVQVPPEQMADTVVSTESLPAGPSKLILIRSVHMEDYYDLTESLFAAKANEGMIAFAGFTVREDRASQEGVLKVSALCRSDRSGYLTLTFVIDLVDSATDKASLEARFSRVDQDALAARLVPDFEMLLDVPLNSFAESPRFFVEELNLYFLRLEGRERRLLEELIVPELADLLDLQFESLEWLNGAEDGGGSVPVGDSDASLVGVLRRHYEASSRGSVTKK
jgi:hypothetical protein